MNYENMSDEELEQLVIQKDGEAICELGERCLYGKNGHEVNRKRAYQLFHKGEKMKLSRAYAGLGAMYRNGWYFAQNEQIAQEYDTLVGNMGGYTPVQKTVENIDIPMVQTPPQMNAPQTNGSQKNCISGNDLQNKLVRAENARMNNNYEEAVRGCNEVISDIEQIQMGRIVFTGDQDIEDSLIEAYWILAFTAFNQQRYSDMENFLRKDNVQAVHPWGVYLMTVGHKITGESGDVFEYDLQMLLTVSNNNNLNTEEKGAVMAMIGDLIKEGYGKKNGMKPKQAEEYYKKAVQYGNEYARTQI